MNTLFRHEEKVSNENDNGRILIEDFRYYQYALIEYFLEVVVDYISNKRNNYLKINKITKEELFTYCGLKNNELDKYTVTIENQNKEIKQFFRLFIPRLIYNNFFILNGNYYVPLFYIIDKPITIKENSINLSSLFSSITFNIKDNICIFTGQNLSIQKFVGLFMFGDESPLVRKLQQHTSFETNEKELVDYFERVFSIKSDIEGYKQYIENFFFDQYTRYLYSTCYANNKINVEVNDLKNIIIVSLDMFYSGRSFNFIDLNNKRLCFIELLLSPLFKKAANIAYQTKKGYPTDEIKIDQYIIMKNFHKSTENKKKGKPDYSSYQGLSGKTQYDFVNFFSSLLTHKCSLVKPGMKSPPSSIALIHETHFEKLCPITISSTKPGEILSIIPEVYVDICGQFLDLNN